MLEAETFLLMASVMESMSDVLRKDTPPVRLRIVIVLALGVALAGYATPLTTRGKDALA